MALLIPVIMAVVFGLYPALYIQSSFLSQQESEPLLLVLAADHVIEDTAAFHQSIMDAIPLAEKGKFVTFGISLLVLIQVMVTFSVVKGCQTRAVMRLLLLLKNLI